MKRDALGLANELSIIGQKIYAVGSLTWSKGRVVLLGDAAHCPSPFSGMGTTGGLVGAYVLAGEINRSLENLPQAFANYDKRVL